MKLIIFVLPVLLSLAIGPVSAAAEPEEGGDASIKLTASRLTGTAPLSVFFDTTESDRFTGGRYLEATCLWDFGDPASRYPRGNGFVAAHVFEEPGTYHVGLRVLDPAAPGVVLTQEVVVTVTAFVPDPRIAASATYYVSALGDDRNDGRSEAKPLLSIRRALSLVKPKPSRNQIRILFRRGDRFELPGTIQASGTQGVVILGAYGEASRPPVWHTSAVDSDYAMLVVGSDWRVMDLAFESDGSTSGRNGSPRYPGGVWFGNGSSHSLLLRLEEANLGDVSLVAGGQFNTQAECSLHDFSKGGYTSDDDRYGSNDSNALIGNREYNVNGDNRQHGFRIQGGTRFYIAHNVFANENPNNDNVTFRGNTDRIVFYGNTVYGHMSILPQNRGNPPIEHQNHIVVDSNLFLSTETFNQQALELQAQDLVLRNNIVVGYSSGFQVSRNALSGHAQRIEIYNNTVLGGERPYFSLAAVDGECQGVRLFNNLLVDGSPVDSKYHNFLQTTRANALAQGASDYNAFFGSAWSPSRGTTFPLQDPNSWSSGSVTRWSLATGNDVHSLTLDPKLLSADRSSPDLARLDPGSPLRGWGRFAGAYVDFFGTLRDQKTPTIGAFELLP